MKNFIIIGVAGYVASKHVTSIYNSKNNLVASLDINDSVGFLDKYFPDSNFFIDFNKFDRYISNKISKGYKIDYCVICSPNYSHDFYIRWSINNNIEVICEKPIVLNPRNLSTIIKISNEKKIKVNTIFQLRYQNDLIQLKNDIDNSNKKMR